MSASPVNSPAIVRYPARPRLMERYREFLPVTGATPIITLGEGSTPLVHLERIGKRIGLPNLFVKYEGMNPTGSFKDRGMVMAISKAVEEGCTAVICASTGNTSASAAAYGAVAGLEVIVVLPKGKIALGKLIQAIAAGAKVVAVDGNFDEALNVVREMAEQRDRPVTLVNSVNPSRIDGQTTAAFEICDDMGRAPDILAIPVGNAGNITAYWAGFNRYQAAGRIAAKPKMYGFQAAGAAPIVLGHPVEKPETIATPSASATRLRGARPSPRATSPAGSSRRSRTTRSWRRTANSPRPRASSASPLLRRAWRAFASSPGRAASTATPPSCAS